MDPKHMKLLAALFFIIDGGAEELDIEGVRFGEDRFYDRAKVTVNYMGEQDRALGALEKAGYIELKRPGFGGELASPYTYEVTITRKTKGLFFRRLVDIVASQPLPEPAQVTETPVQKDPIQVEDYEVSTGFLYKVTEDGKALVDGLTEDEANRIAHALRVVAAHPELAAK